MIKHTSKLEVIHRQLRDEILGGIWRHGDKLPTEPELAERFDCSIGTISKAVSFLAHEGLVERRTKAGTRVIGRTQKEDSQPLALDSLAFVYPSSQLECMARTVKGFQAAAMEADCRVMLLTTGQDCGKEIEFLNRIADFAVKGAVISPMVTSAEEYVRLGRALISCQMPLVLTGVPLLASHYSVIRLDYFHIGYTCARHLINRGGKRIGYLSNYAWMMEECYNGYRWALEEAGIEPREEWILREPSMHPDFNDPIREPALLAEGYLDSCGGVDGVVCTYDFLAIGLMRAARKRGLLIPRDLMIVGVDDIQLAESNDVPLTTYHIPFEEKGRKTFELLRSLVAGEGTKPADIKIRGELVVRASA